MADQNKRYTIDFTLPGDADDAVLEDIKNQIDPLFVSVVRQHNGSITVGPNSGSITDTPS